MNLREYMELYGEDPNELDRDEPDEGFCSECGKPCKPVKIDFGIGPYEFWGSKGYHHDYQWVSPCCEAKVEE